MQGRKAVREDFNYEYCTLLVERILQYCVLLTVRGTNSELVDSCETKAIPALSQLDLADFVPARLSPYITPQALTKATRRQFCVRKKPNDWQHVLHAR